MSANKLNGMPCLLQLPQSVYKCLCTPLHVGLSAK